MTKIKVEDKRWREEVGVPKKERERNMKGRAGVFSMQGQAAPSA